MYMMKSVVLKIHPRLIQMIYARVPYFINILLFEKSTKLFVLLSNLSKPFL